MKTLAVYSSRPASFARRVGFQILTGAAMLPVLAATARAEGDDLVAEASTQIASLKTTAGTLVLAALGITLAFVVFKVVKRAVNKA